jgi:hypothetical protein
MNGSTLAGSMRQITSDIKSIASEKRNAYEQASSSRSKSGLARHSSTATLALAVAEPVGRRRAAGTQSEHFT